MNKFFYDNDNDRYEAERYLNTDNLQITHDFKLWLKLTHIQDCNDFIDWLTIQIKHYQIKYKDGSEELTDNKCSAIADWLIRSVFQVRDDYYAIRERLDHDEDPENW